MRNWPVPNDPWFIGQLEKIIEIFNLKRNGDNSFAGEAGYVNSLLSKLAITCGWVVDIAASNGVSQSCTLQLFESDQWKGLAVEMDPLKFAILSFIYSGFSDVRLARCRATPYNVCDLLKANEVPPDFELLNLDIDSYDLYVIEAILKGGFRPKVITMEINEKIPPPIYFTVTYEENHYWRGDHFYGCSITAAEQMIKPYGYCLESVQFNNAFFVREDYAGGHGLTDLTAEDAYNAGYALRADRSATFPWNANVDSALTGTPEEGVELFKRIYENYTNYILHCNSRHQ